MELFSTTSSSGNKPIYTPLFRARQEEIKVLKEFNFGNKIFPLMEIVKAYDRKNNMKPFDEIYGGIIAKIKSPKVFVDLPLYLNDRRSNKPEVLEFVLTVISDWEKRTEHLLQLQKFKDKIIPIISSYSPFNGNDYIQQQVDVLRPMYKNIGFRVSYKNYLNEMEILQEFLQKEDFVLLDFEHVNSSPTSPALKDITKRFANFKGCHKIVIRSAINNDVINKDLENNEVIYEADNSIIEQYKSFGGDSFGDYAGIKKDSLTGGGSISPGFIYFDGTRNQYFGFKYTGRRDLDAFQNDIVPAVLRSDATERMTASEIDFLTDQNKGWQTLNKVYDGSESGKNQAKFKGISMMHYLHCIRKLIEHNPHGQFQFES